MIRDDLPYKTNGTNVTGYQLSNSSFANATALSQVSLQLFTSQDKDSVTDLRESPSNRTSVIGNNIYNLYNPDTGINIASVLGGLLVVLVIYVIYRTKCRKRILGAFQRCIMKYFNDEFPEMGNEPKREQNYKPNGTERISGNTKMISKGRADLMLDSGRGGTELFNDTASYVNCGGNQYETGSRRLSIHTCAEECDEDCVINMYYPYLPDLEEDIEQSTAQWVQNVREMDIKERQLNGIILKIPPDLVSHSSKIRSHFNSMTEYMDDFDDIALANISLHRNVSLPCLIEKRTLGKNMNNYAKTNRHSNNNQTFTCGYVPLASQENVDLDLDYDIESLTQPPEVYNNSEPKVPIDICPIVNVEHYHSRSKRRLTSLCRSSSDEFSSTSSEEQNGGAVLSSAKEATYKRLQTDDRDYRNSSNRDKTSFTNNCVKVSSNFNRKQPIVGHNSETAL